MPRPTIWRRIAIFSTAAVVLAAASATSLTWLLTRRAAPRVIRTTIATTGPAALTINGIGRDLAVTPDGTRVVYSGNSGTQLFVRPLDQLEPTALAGQSGSVFTSPDGQWVGYASSTARLTKVAITGGPPVALLVADGQFRGATWAPDDTIIFATANGATGLQRVSAAGGKPEVLTTPDAANGESDHFWPELLPDNRGILFTISRLEAGWTRRRSRCSIS